jgi:protein gp37
VNKTSIEWCNRPGTLPRTWNPIRARLKGQSEKVHSGTFCTRISPGCTNCYASAINKRFGNGLEYTVPNLENVEFFLSEKILQEPLKTKKPCTIFVGDMFDLFHEAIPDQLVFDVLTAIAEISYRHTFQALTKRADRMRWFIEGWMRSHTERPIPNLWLGVSVESQKYADERIPLLLQTPAAVRFLSVEPQLEHVDLLRAHLQCERPFSTPGVNWVICGGESGPKARPFNLAWAESLQEQCKAAGVAFFMKQVGSKPIGPNHLIPHIPLRDRKGGDPSEWPESLRVREFPA